MVSFDGGSARKVDDVTALPSRHKMADMCYYGNGMTTTRWWLCVTILHLQQYSHRLNFYFLFFNITIPGTFGSPLRKCTEFLPSKRISPASAISIKSVIY